MAAVELGGHAFGRFCRFGRTDSAVRRRRDRICNKESRVRLRWAGSDGRILFGLFSGGVPPLAFTEIKFQDVLSVARQSQSTDGELDFTCELCLIGLASYFEAFCKDCFAAIINICPEIAETFASRRETTIAVTDLLDVKTNTAEKLGFLIAEKLDFGTAKAINSLYGDLLKVSPFSTDEMKRYSKFIDDRNLIVHHGSVVTLRYEKSPSGTKYRDRVHQDSIVINKRDVVGWARFLFTIAKKIAKSSKEGITQFAAKRDISLDRVRKEAIDVLDASGLFPEIANSPSSDPQ